MRFDELERLVRQCLDEFFRRRLQVLNELDLRCTLRRKNPYLFRATGVQLASDIVEKLLQAFMSSSEETIFGDSFFEPIARVASGGRAADAEGLDVTIETDDEYTVVAVKSGPNWGNSQQKRRLQQNFMAARGIFLTRRDVRKQFRALLGQSYGRSSSEPNDTKIYRTRSGQAFWQEITSDPDFYLDLIRAIGDYPLTQTPVYEDAWNRAVNRFEREFLNDFSTADGDIDWERLAQFNSGVEPPRLPPRRRQEG